MNPEALMERVVAAIADGALVQAETRLAALWGQSRAAGTPEAESTAWFTEGMLRDAQGRLAESEEAFESALALDRGIGDARIIEARLNSLCIVRKKRGNHEGALGARRQIVELYRVEQRFQLPRVLCDLGAALLAQSRIEEAVTACREAVTTAREEALTPLPDFARATVCLGESLRRAARSPEAMAYFTMSTRTANRLGPTAKMTPTMRQAIASAWGGIGVVSEHVYGARVQAAIAYWYASELFVEADRRASCEQRLALLPQRSFAHGDPSCFRVVRYHAAKGYINVASSTRGFYQVKTEQPFALGQLVAVTIDGFAVSSVRPLG